MMRDAWLLFVSFGALTGISWLSLSKTQRQWLQTWLIRGMGALLAGLILFQEGPWEFLLLVFLGLSQSLLLDSFQNAPLWILGWCIASRSFFFIRPLGSLIAQKPFLSFALIAVVSLLLKLIGPWNQRTTEGSRVRNSIERVLRILALLAFIPLCSQFYEVNERGGVTHHLSAFVGAVEMLRQGGLPWWDVPIQYGTLMTWVIAQLPFQHALHSFVFFNSIVIWTACSVLFWAGMTCFRGVLGLLFSFALTLGSIIILVAPSYIPSSGPLRFIFCFLLLAGWFWGRPFASQKRLLFLSGVWILGCWWSFESACYSTVIHFAGLLSHGLPSPEEASPRMRWNLFWSHFKRLQGPLVAFTGVLLVIVGLFTFLTGHFPDLIRSSDFARSFALGFTKIVHMYVRPSIMGALWIPFGMMVLFFFYPASQASHSVVGLAGVWILISYYLGRGHESNLLNLTPLFLLCLYQPLSQYQNLPLSFQRLLKAFGIPLISGCFLACIHWYMFSQLQSTFTHSLLIFQSSPIDQIPPLDPELQELFAQRGLDPAGPWIMSSANLPVGKVLPRAWVPFFPGSLLGPLNPRIRWIYWERFLERTRSSGWVLVPPPEEAWALPPELVRTHRLTEEHLSASGKWKLLHFEILPREEWVPWTR